ncbi:Uncharacterised protein [Candidatus Gugararchaeum adminiculabundum]|nr:Uncharacterised protein [Candidatus Gugararchaeum adminiculabundum]
MRCGIWVIVFCLVFASTLFAPGTGTVTTADQPRQSDFIGCNNPTCKYSYLEMAIDQDGNVAVTISYITLKYDKNAPKSAIIEGLTDGQISPKNVINEITRELTATDSQQYDYGKVNGVLVDFSMNGEPIIGCQKLPSGGGGVDGVVVCPAAKIKESALTWGTAKCGEIEAAFAGDVDLGLFPGSSATYYCQETPMVPFGAPGVIFSDAAKTNILPQCLFAFLIGGIFVGAIYARGGNPLAMFDLTTPRVPKGKKYQFKRGVVVTTWMHLRQAVKIEGTRLAVALGKANAEFARRLGMAGVNAGSIERIMKSSVSDERKALALKALALGISMNEIERILTGQLGKEKMWELYSDKIHDTYSTKRQLRESLMLVDNALLRKDVNRNANLELDKTIGTTGWVGKVPLVASALGNMRVYGRIAASGGKTLLLESGGARYSLKLAELIAGRQLDKYRNWIARNSVDGKVIASIHDSPRALSKDLGTMEKTIVHELAAMLKHNNELMKELGLTGKEGREKLSRLVDLMLLGSPNEMRKFMKETGMTRDSPEYKLLIGKMKLAMEIRDLTRQARNVLAAEENAGLDAEGLNRSDRKRAGDLEQLLRKISDKTASFSGFDSYENMLLHSKRDYETMLDHTLRVHADMNALNERNERLRKLAARNDVEWKEGMGYQQVLDKLKGKLGTSPELTGILNDYEDYRKRIYLAGVKDRDREIASREVGKDISKSKAEDLMELENLRKRAEKWETYGGTGVQRFTKDEREMSRLQNYADAIGLNHLPDVLDRMHREMKIYNAVVEKNLRPGQDFTYKMLKEGAWFHTYDKTMIPYIPHFTIALTDKPLGRMIYTDAQGKKQLYDQAKHGDINTLVAQGRVEMRSRFEPLNFWETVTKLPFMKLERLFIGTAWNEINQQTKTYSLLEFNRKLAATFMDDVERGRFSQLMEDRNKLLGEMQTLMRNEYFIRHGKQPQIGGLSQEAKDELMRTHGIAAHEFGSPDLLAKRIGELGKQISKEDHLKELRKLYYATHYADTVADYQFIRDGRTLPGYGVEQHIRQGYQFGTASIGSVAKNFGGYGPMGWNYPGARIISMFSKPSEYLNQAFIRATRQPILGMMGYPGPYNQQMSEHKAMSLPGFAKSFRDILKTHEYKESTVPVFRGLFKSRVVEQVDPITGKETTGMLQPRWGRGAQGGDMFGGRMTRGTWFAGGGWGEGIAASAKGESMAGTRGFGNKFYIPFIGATSVPFLSSRVYGKGKFTEAATTGYHHLYKGGTGGPAAVMPEDLWYTQRTMPGSGASLLRYKQLALVERDVTEFSESTSLTKKSGVEKRDRMRQAFASYLEKDFSEYMNIPELKGSFYSDWMRRSKTLSDQTLKNLVSNDPQEREEASMKFRKAYLPDPKTARYELNPVTGQYEVKARSYLTGDQWAANLAMERGMYLLHKFPMSGIISPLAGAYFVGKGIYGKTRNALSSAHRAQAAHEKEYQVFAKKIKYCDVCGGAHIDGCTCPHKLQATTGIGGAVRRAA